MNSVAVLLPIVVAAASTSAAQAASPVEFIISDAGRELVDRVAEDVFSERALLLKYTVGTMIELLRRYKARKAVPGRRIESISSREAWDLRKTLAKRAVAARTEHTVGEGALHPGSVGPIWRTMIRKAFDRGALLDLTVDDVARLLKGVSAHSTRVGLNQDLFASGEDLAGIMDALRWKSPRMPLAYNRNLAAEQGAAGRLMAKIG